MSVDKWSFERLLNASGILADHEITKYMIKSPSTNKEDVIAACQALGVVGNPNIIDPLSELLDYWKLDRQVNVSIAIQQAIDAIKAMEKDSGQR